MQQNESQLFASFLCLTKSNCRQKNKASNKASSTLDILLGPDNLSDKIPSFSDKSFLKFYST